MRKARPMARGMKRRILGPPSTVSVFTYSRSTSTWPPFCSALATAERRSLATGVGGRLRPRLRGVLGGPQPLPARHPPRVVGEEPHLARREAQEREPGVRTRGRGHPLRAGSLGGLLRRRCHLLRVLGV